MRNPDNHVSISTDMVKNIGDILVAMEGDEIYPDKVVITQTNSGDRGEFSLAYEVDGE